MKFPCEIISEPFITQLRVKAAQSLHKIGYTQNQIAELLQVSQPVISGYLKKSKHLSHLPDLLVTKANEIGSQIANILHYNGIEGTPEAIGLGCQTCKILRQSGPTCIYHKSQTNFLEENCTRCLSGSKILDLQYDKEAVLVQLRDFYNQIIAMNKIEKVFPEIGLQIVYSTKEPTSMTDVAAFPGRIHKRKSRPPLAETPSFGSSETTSFLLLLLRIQGFQIRSIITLKNTEWLKKKTKKANIDFVEIDKFDMDPEKYVEGIEKKLTAPFMIMGAGGIGYEAICYLCAKSISSLLSTLSSLID